MGDTFAGQPERRAPRRDRRSAAGSSVLTPPTGLPAVPDSDVGLPSPQVERPGRADAATDGPQPVLPPPVRPVVVDPCACGHAKAAHEHYRPGTDCGACGAAECATFRPEGGPRRTFRMFGRTSGQ